MKLFLLSLIAAIALPTLVNAESGDAALARIQFPKLIKLAKNGKKFYEMEDYEAACSKQSELIQIVVTNFEGLQEIRPDIDWFDFRKKGLELKEKVCGFR